MRQGLLAAVGMCLAALTTPAQAQVTGGKLVHTCDNYATGADMTQEHAVCTAYVQGVLDGHQVGYMVATLEAAQRWDIATQKARDINKTQAVSGYCGRDGLTLAQVIRVVQKWLTEHPERHHERADLLIPEALQDAFGQAPCD